VEKKRWHPIFIYLTKKGNLILKDEKRDMILFFMRKGKRGFPISGMKEKGGGKELVRKRGANVSPARSFQKKEKRKKSRCPLVKKGKRFATASRGKEGRRLPIPTQRGGRRKEKKEGTSILRGGERGRGGAPLNIYY